MRISDWSSDVCSSDLIPRQGRRGAQGLVTSAWRPEKLAAEAAPAGTSLQGHGFRRSSSRTTKSGDHCWPPLAPFLVLPVPCSSCPAPRSEEHTSELQSLMRISYAVFCLKQNKDQTSNTSKQSVNIN